MTEIETLEFEFSKAKNSPWNTFFRLDWETVIQTLEYNGFNSAKELIKKYDIRAYRADEALNGDI